MRRWWLLCLASTLGASEPIRLHYIPNAPVEVISQLELEIDNALPGFKLDARGGQTVQAILSVQGDQTGLPIDHPPFQLLFTFKNIQVDLLANHVRTGFSTAHPSTSLQLAQANRLIDRPLLLQFDAQGGLMQNDELQKLFAELPLLKQIGLNAFLAELFQPFTAIFGRDLSVGDKFQFSQPKGFVPQVNYEIIAIDDDVVEAKFSGQIESKIPLEGETQSDPMLSLSGAMEGHVSWSRHNALDCTVEALYVYSGVLSMGDSSWALNYNLKHTLSKSEVPEASPIR